MNNLDLPSAFTERIRKQLGNEADSFFSSLQQPSPVSIRIHPYKFPSEHAWYNLPQVPWCKQGYYLSDRPTFTLDPLFHAGTYYVQEASSMILHHVLEQILPKEKAHLKVLDLCAAPGGKSTLLSSFLDGEGLLISNEVIRSRISALKQNIIRWGYDNVIITNNDPEDFVSSEIYFDVVVVDAPCSGEGLFRKDPKSILEWSVENTKHCTLRQKRILEAATKIVADEGFLIYCTCTFNPEENELHQKQIIESGFEPVSISTQPEWNISQPATNSLQFYPHKNQGEGFYIAVFKKIKNFEKEVYYRKKTKIEIYSSKSFESFITLPENRAMIRMDKQPISLFPLAWLDLLEVVASKLRMVQAGIEAGEIRGKDVIPSHALAMSFYLHQDIVSFELDDYQAKLFLSKERIELSESIPKGLVLITYKHIPLGWVKNLGNRINNYFPQKYRIRMKWK